MVTPAQIQRLLIEQVTSPVLWEKSVISACHGKASEEVSAQQGATNEGVKEFIEVGPGKVLASLIGQTGAALNRKLTTWSVGTAKDVLTFCQQYKDEEKASADKALLHPYPRLIANEQLLPSLCRCYTS